MWLEAKCVPDHKHMFILQLFGKEGLHCWETSPLAAPIIKKRNSQTMYWKPFEG